MAINEVEINTTALDRDASQMSTTLRQIKAETGGIYEAVQALNRMWSGTANEAFMRQFQVDHARMESLCNVVQELIRSMNEASQIYKKGETKTGDIITAIKL